MIRNKKANKYGTIVISILMAVLLWFYVVNQEATGSPRGNVEVELSYVNAGADFTINGPPTVSVSMWGAAPDPGDIRAYVDLAGLGEGEHRLNVHVAPVQGALLTSVQPSEVWVELIGVEEKQLRISRELIGNPASGVALSEVALSSEHCVVRGDSASLAAVAVVAAPIIIEGVSGILDQEVVLQARDADGNLISGLTLLPEQVRVMAVAEYQLSSRVLEIDLQTSGQPAEGYELGSINMEPQQVTVFGYENLLRNLEVISTELLDLEGRQSSFSTGLSLNLLAGLSSSTSQVQVEVEITAVASIPVVTDPVEPDDPNRNLGQNPSTYIDTETAQGERDEADRS